MTGSMGRTSLLPPPSDTTLLCAERNAWRKIHEMVHQGTTLSDALKPNSPSVPWPDHWAFKNPKGVAYCRDHHLHLCPVRKDGWVCDAPPSKHAPQSPSQVTGGHSGCHRPRGFPVSVGITGHHRGESHPHQSHSGRQTERGPGRPQMGGDFSRAPGSPSTKEEVPARALQKGGSIPFPRTHRGSGKTFQCSNGGKNRQGKHQGSDKGHTESLEGQAPPSHGCRTSRKD